MRLKAAPGRPVSVLVVDDEELVRKFVERVMREAGYETATAADGPEALEVAARLETFDILVTDVMMPQMTGDELARRIRASTPGIKVLYLTGFSDRLFKEKVSLLLFGRIGFPQDHRP
jgi:CheY-like chemotaxis protein